SRREEIEARIAGTRGQPGRPDWGQVADAIEAGWFAPVGGVTPPVDWPVWAGRWPEQLVLWRDRDGVDVLEVLTVADATRRAALSVPHTPEGELLAAWEADGRPDALGLSLRETEQGVRLGRPGLLAHRLGWSASGWHAWPDGSWRCPGRPLDTCHTVTATPLAGGRLRLVVLEQPGDWVQLDVDVPAGDDGLNELLDRYGYTVDSGLWDQLPGGVRYAPARPGRLAERDWSTSARVRVVRETTVGAVDPRVDRTFRVGEVLTMYQSGRAGRQVDRRSWWSSHDIDGAHILPADAVEIVEVLIDRPPTWADAALSAEQITALLAPHHPGAAAAAAAWIAAGLHVSHDLAGLAIRTRPAGPRIGIIDRDYWNGDVHSKPYEAVLVDGEQSWQCRTRALPTLPLDPIAAADPT
ncbi:hypothetical protein, partial [Parafrankia soli]|uniref:hypothetical protein n=1 Tax=Parafrankia soli TaxID=2599596 RepID=UPI0012FF6B51